MVQGLEARVNPLELQRLGPWDDSLSLSVGPSSLRFHVSVFEVRQKVKARECALSVPVLVPMLVPMLVPALVRS